RARTCPGSAGGLSCPWAPDRGGSRHRRHVEAPARGRPMSFNIGPPPSEPRQGETGGGGLQPPVPWKTLAVAAAILVVLVTANVLKSIYVDFLWFRSVGFESVFRTRITTQVWLFLAGAVAAAVVIGGNLLLARRF